MESNGNNKLSKIASENVLLPVYLQLVGTTLAVRDTTTTMIILEVGSECVKYEALFSFSVDNKVKRSIFFKFLLKKYTIQEL